MEILLTFAGNRDPLHAEIISGVFTDGPVLTLLAERSFAAIHILTTPNTLLNAQQLQKAILTRTKNCRIRIHDLNIPDPTDYEALFLHMSGLCREIVEGHRDQQPQYSIATASGTPQMQTVWFLLAQSGLVPAKLLKITPPRFLRPDQKAVTEICLSMESFPRIILPSSKTLELAATCLRKEKLEAEREELVREFSGLRMIGRSPALTKVLDTVRAAAMYDSAILIQGETGTGKELVARAIHFNSNRKTEPVITINCSAIPETLVESELFGHEKGTFTGADRQKRGKFELADKGTIFLDEIGDMPLPAQAKILRVLQDKTITRVGGDKVIPADVRVIAATNRNLPQLITEGRFREDLYYRLRVIEISVPPLRERREDIPLLVEYFLDRHNRRYHQKKQFNREAMRRVLEYPWPGNVRELENSVERAFVLSGGNVIKDADLPPEILSPPSHFSAANGGPLHSEQIFPSGASGGRVTSVQTSATGSGVILIPPEGMNLGACLEDLEKVCYEEAIRRKDANREAAARLLGVKPHTFRKRAKEKFGL